MNKKAKDICINEMTSDSVGELIWKEAQKELIGELLKEAKCCCGAGEYCYEEGPGYSTNEYTDVIHIRILKDKLGTLN